MRLWWVSISLFMEWEGEQEVVIFSCCSSNGIPHWLMRLERSEELVLLLFICSLAKAVSDVNDAMML